jgi:SAM-dependent methyltransferase
MEAPATACPLCGNATSLQHALSHASARRCPAVDCGLRFADPQPDDAALRDAYRALYYPDGNAPPGGERSAELVDWDETPPGTLRELVEAITKRLGRADGARMLDYGCGRGALGRVAMAAGLDTTGIELDDEARRTAQRDAGLRAYTRLGDLRHAEPDARFDVITLWQVIEHLRRPWEDLEALRELLTPEGFMVIATPNAECLRARLEGARWENVSNPTHLYYFSERSLQRLVGASGLAPVDRLFLPGSYPHHGFMRRRVQGFLRARRLDGDIVFVVQPRESVPA